jgi:hypothetical protein
MTEYNKGKGIHTINCPHPECSKDINIFTIERLVGSEISVKLEQRTISLKLNLFSCPNTSCRAKFELPDNFLGRHIHCIGCNQNFCRLCNENYHEGICQFRIQVKLIINFKKTCIINLIVNKKIQRVRY